jgi:hypothetical protein
VERFELRGTQGQVWAEIVRDSGRLQLAVKGDVATLPLDHRLHLFSPDGQQLNLTPQADLQHNWISSADANGLIRLNLDRDGETDDILGLVAPVEIRLRWFSASPDYFRLLQVE